MIIIVNQEEINELTYRYPIEIVSSKYLLIKMKKEQRINNDETFIITNIKDILKSNVNTITYWYLDTFNLIKYYSFNKKNKSDLSNLFILINPINKILYL